MGIRTPSLRALLHASAFISLLVAAGAEVAMLPVIPVEKPEIAANPTAYLPQGEYILSNADRLHYRQAFALQRAGSMDAADSELAQTENGLLKDTVLAERYQNKNYQADYRDLAGWLAANADSPAAENIYRLALARKPADAAIPEEPAVSRSLKGFSSGYARSVLHDNKTWVAGIIAFKHKDMTTAAHHFRTLADGDNALTPADKAAASFWAYRVLKAQGDKGAAARYLEKASDFPSGFYSLLARSLTGEGLASNSGARKQDFAALLAQLPVKRAVALKEIGEDTLAENELRALYPAADKLTRGTLLALARQLDLPAVQMRMAGSDAEAFPVPSWEPASGYHVERALLFAIMRQESGFNPNARSPSGAMGLMQLMPATAHEMAHQSHQLGHSYDPSVNMALGQHYVENLMNTPQIGDNLIYITAAYNAGPGAVINWLRGNNENDPLLFIESLPYAQTREYVVHVVGNYWVYSQLLDGTNPASLKVLAGGGWPRYAGAERQLVALLTRAD